MKGGVLKFLDKCPQRTQSLGKKCFPQKSIGVSKEAPKEFQLRNTLINKEGYIWNQPQTQPLLSHTRYVSIVGNGHAPNNFHQEFEKRTSQDAVVFNKKKGLLSEYMNRHAWQGKVVPLMGSERSPEARRLRNRDVQKSKQKQRQKYQKKLSSTFNRSLDQSSYHETIPVSIEQKNRIRKKRNQLYDEEMTLVSSKRKSNRKVDPESMDRFISNKNDTVSFLRLFCPELHQNRPFSQTYRSGQSWLYNTMRSNITNKSKIRETQSMKHKDLRSTIDEFDIREVEQFEGRHLKNGIFKALRSKKRHLQA